MCQEAVAISAAARNGQSLTMEWIIVIFVVAVIVAGIAAHYEARKRREALAGFAAQHGWQFQAERAWDIGDQYPGFDIFDVGSRRYAENMLTGGWRDNATNVFDYHYQVRSGSGKNRRTRHYRFTIVMMKPPFPVRPISIRPEQIWDKLTAAFGWDDIDFESAEFSRRFHVKAPDRRWAFDVLTPRTMEVLLEQAGSLTMEMSDTHLLLRLHRRMKVEEISAALDTGAALLDGIPAFARQAAGA